MDPNETVVPSGGHYSGSNRIPNIRQFMERLDQEKKDRDAKIDDEAKQRGKAPAKTSAEVKAHNETTQKQGKNRRTVRDPVTGKNVEIDDMDGDMMKAAQDPQVRPPFSPFWVPRCRRTALSN